MVNGSLAAAMEVAARGAVAGATPTFRDGEAENRVNMFADTMRMHSRRPSAPEQATEPWRRAEVSRAAGHVTF